MEYEKMIHLPKVYVRAYTFAEAELIMKVMMRIGYEGVQNDSYRYCDLMASCALDSGRCYILNGSYSIYVSNIHDKKTRRGRKEVSRSKFFSMLGIKDDFKKVVFYEKDRILCGQLVRKEKYDINKLLEEKK